VTKERDLFGASALDWGKRTAWKKVRRSFAGRGT